MQNAAWVKSPVDQFLLRGLEEKGLRPGRPRRTSDAPAPRLLRPDRLAADADRSRGVPQRRDADRPGKGRGPPAGVDRFGERWGRHWLDLVRYAESRGHEFDSPIPNAYQYRDYVIRALNADVPYNQFVTEHIAGDLLTDRGNIPTTRLQRVDPRHRLLAARRGSPLAGRYPPGSGRPLRQPHRRDDQDVPRPDGLLRPLSRPQVRRHFGQGLLRLVWLPRKQRPPSGPFRHLGNRASCGGRTHGESRPRPAGDPESPGEGGPARRRATRRPAAGST